MRSNSIWCSFKGVSCNDIGFRLVALPDRPMAELKAILQSVPGRNGDLLISEGAYRDFDIKVRLEATRNADFEAFGSWLDGTGDLIFSDMTFPEEGQEQLNAYAYTARVVRQITNRHGRYLDGADQYDITFHCEPFKHLMREQPVTANAATGFMGEGNQNARPLITLNGSGNVNFMINEYSLLISNLSGRIIIDCEAMMAIQDGENVSNIITIVADDNHPDDFPQLYPGYNQINWSGTLTPWTDDDDVTHKAVEIIPRWRWR